ncbi:MAG: T9SS type A sorting domain-containing protein [Chitinophagales bacterium]
MKTLIKKQNLWLGLLFAGFTFLVPNSMVYGATVSSITSGNWNDDATWDGNAPGAGDTANIMAGHTVNVTANATISQVTVNANDTDPSTLEVKSGVKLTVTDRIFIEATDFNASRILVFGELEAQGVIAFNGVFASGLARIEIRDASSYIKIAGEIDGNGSKGEIFSDGTIGTIEFSSSSAQDIPSLYHDYYDLILSGISTKSLSDNIVINNNLSINSSTAFDASASNYNISIGGNWVNNGGTFNARNGMVTFNGTTAQAVTSNNEDFYNVTFNNTASGITLNDNMNVINNCTMTDGVVHTGSNTLTLESTSAASMSGFSDTSFVNGNLRRYIASNTDAYAFPVGNGGSTTNYFRADIVNNNMESVSYIDASFGSLVNHNDADMNVEDSWIYYDAVHTSGMWTIEPSSQPSAGEYDVRLYIANISGLSDNSFAPIKRPNGSTGTAWTADGRLSGDGGEGRMASEDYTVRFELSSFSEIGVGTGEPTGLGLPIELLEFAGKKSGSSVALQWVTATEINNDYYSLERSLDGINFTSIATINGAGNSLEQLNYQHFDSDPADGINYYRLKQTDFDGTYTYSSVISVEFSNPENNILTANIYPNPVNSGTAVKINFSNPITGNPNVQIYSAGSGKMVFNQQINNENAKVDVPANLSSGLYFVRISTDNWEHNQKLVVQ